VVTIVSIPKYFVVDEDDNKIAVQIPIEAFMKLEKIVEEYESAQRRREAEKDKLLKIQEAKGFYIASDDTV
jgi:hypothetical protein